MKKNINNGQLIELTEMSAEQSVQFSNDVEVQATPKKKTPKPLLTELEVINICFEWLDKIYGDNASQACVEQIIPEYQMMAIEISFELSGLSLSTKRPTEDSKNWRVCKRFDVCTKTGEVGFMKNA